MEFTSKSLYFFAIVALSTCQYYDSYQKFRPSPVDNPHDYTITHYNPNDYIMSYKPTSAPYPSHGQPPLYQQYGYPAVRPQYYPELGQHQQQIGQHQIGQHQIGQQQIGQQIGQQQIGQQQLPLFGRPQSQLVQPQLGQFGPGKPLFTPADQGSAAATLGQIDNFNKALREEAEENQKTGFLSGIGLPSSSGFGKSYVDVKFGGPNNLRYQYTL